MRRFATTTGVIAASLLGLATPAIADGGWGNTTCSQIPTPSCELGVGDNGNNGRPSGPPGQGDNTPHRPDSDNNPGTDAPDKPGDSVVGGDSTLASCSYVKSDYQPPAGGLVTAAHRPLASSGGVVHAAVSRPVLVRAQAAQPGQGPGAWYVWKCTTEGVTDGLYRPPVWIADGQQPGPALLPSPAELAQVARKQLRFPSPRIAANPVGEQLVNLPTWMWLAGGWGPVSATAAVPGVSVTAVATPTSVTWSMGDGFTVTCTGAGTPYVAGVDPKAPSPDCGHVYRRSSASRPGQAYPVTATVHWTVTWSGAGQGGTFPDMTTTGETTFRVAESQALNNGG
ncbi:hypothetical protein [Actinokineospora spheciospongiae]|uniref:hypothetical protein n=1 Tax=Actinokineospora spheciospongiae TaxID=909613 RepID=UPI000D9E50DC|nr:hypothetical protein [Actinokineospora spheciospongiae]PWW53106.1 hypothetical protein DFQ13_11696 [Actinokineospora spheciospongiae]